MASIDSLDLKDFEISDKKLLAMYKNRASYCQVKRKVVEMMYERAVEQELREQYEHASHRRDINQ